MSQRTGMWGGKDTMSKSRKGNEVAPVSYNWEGDYINHDCAVTWKRYVVGDTKKPATTQPSIEKNRWGSILTERE